MKRCSECHVEKPLESFHRDGSRSDGHQIRCRACDNRRSSQRYYASLVELRQRARERARAKSAQRPPRLCPCGAEATSRRHRYCDRCRALAELRYAKTDAARGRRRELTRRSSTERGYGTEHQRLRREWKRRVEAGGVDCARCHRPIQPGTLWDLGHHDFDRTRYTGPEHRHCNRSAGATLNNLKGAHSRRW